MTHYRGVYRGNKHPELRGYWAILRPTSGGNWLAQFDAGRPFTHGWHFFFARDFELKNATRIPESQAKRRYREKQRIAEYVAVMKKWAATAGNIRSMYERHYPR